MTALKLSRLPDGEPEIFASVQGEGVSLGLPSVFVRLALCNLRCTWCDTRYTWDWSQFDPKTEVIKLTPSDIVERVTRIAPVITNVVLTGGEPLQQQAPLAALSGMLKEAGHRLEVETNGTFRPGPALADLVDQWNVSPKLASSGNAIEARTNPEALEWFAQQPHAYLKFVVVEPSDLAEVDTLVQQYQVPPDRVLLMPEGADAQTIAARSDWLVQSCLTRGYRFSTRLHVYLWGATRGR